MWLAGALTASVIARSHARARARWTRASFCDRGAGCRLYLLLRRAEYFLHGHAGGRYVRARRASGAARWGQGGDRRDMRRSQVARLSPLIRYFPALPSSRAFIAIEISSQSSATRNAGKRRSAVRLPLWASASCIRRFTLQRQGLRAAAPSPGQVLSGRWSPRHPDRSLSALMRRAAADSIAPRCWSKASRQR